MTKSEIMPPVPGPDLERSATAVSSHSHATIIYGAHSMASKLTTLTSIPSPPSSSDEASSSTKENDSAVITCTNIPVITSSNHISYTPIHHPVVVTKPSEVIAFNPAQSYNNQWSNPESNIVEAKAYPALAVTSTTNSVIPGVPRKKKRQPQPIPEECKDRDYWERRKRNNESAKRSREVRRLKEQQTSLRVIYLENDNLRLRTEVNMLRSELDKLRQMLCSQHLVRT